MRFHRSGCDLPFWSSRNEVIARQLARQLERAMLLVLRRVIRAVIDADGSREGLEISEAGERHVRRGAHPTEPSGGQPNLEQT